MMYLASLCLWTLSLIVRLTRWVTLLASDRLMMLWTLQVWKTDCLIVWSVTGVGVVGVVGGCVLVVGGAVGCAGSTVGTMDLGLAGPWERCLVVLWRLAGSPVVIVAWWVLSFC